MVHQKRRVLLFLFQQPVRLAKRTKRIMTLQHYRTHCRSSLLVTTLSTAICFLWLVKEEEEEDGNDGKHE